MVTGDETVITVFEGEVSVSTDSGEVNVLSGHRVTARTGQLPVAQVAVHPQDAVQWMLYYAPILDYEGPAADEEASPGQVKDPFFYTGRAAQRLAVGRAEEALTDIKQALSIDPANVDALALQSIIAVAQNDPNTALTLANRAVAQDPGSAAAMIALSYAQQALFEIPDALATLRRAVDRNPSHGPAWARLSELWLAVGNLNQTLDAAQTAVSLDSNVARTQTVLGFAYLSQVEIALAVDAFQQAIVLDQAAPLPRLGLGLARIRGGDLPAGREEIEIAVVLDPTNALTRSYMGKAYYEEKRDDLAESQLHISKQLDPLDPTPWFYDAIRKQTVNQPIAALDDLQESIELNDNRAIYRSNLKLDQDMAARSASLGRIYRDLGFEQRALVEGWQSVNGDPSDFSGHRLLADSYSVLPRHEVARVSELLQSQLLQPINISPIQPQLAETNLFVLSGAGPSSIGFNEFNPLFASNGLRLQANAVVGENNTRGNDLVVSGIADRFSFSLGQFHYETDGIRDNNDQDRDLYNLFAQVELSVRTHVQAEIRSAEADTGDLGILFDAEDFSPNSRAQENFDLGRVGIHHEFAPGSEIIANLAYVEGDIAFDDSSFDPSFGIGSNTQIEEMDRGWNLEIQHIYRSDQWRLVSGVGAFEADRQESILFDLLIDIPPFPPISISLPSDVSESTVTQENLYVYALIDQSDQLTWTLGVSADYYEEEAFDSDQWNPKFGLTWRVNPDTTLRAAAFRTLTRPLAANQTIEPTQVAGFNQFFDGIEGEEAWRYGAAIDYRYTQRLHGGFEYSIRDLTVPVEFPVTLEVERFDWDEKFARTYLHWAATDRLALGVDYLFEDFEREGIIGIDRTTELTTHRLPVTLSYFNPNGWTTRVTATLIDQEGEFQSTPPSSGSDDFTVVDVDISYRLPKRYGIVSLIVKNLLDEEFQFQDTDPSNPRILPDRQVLFNASLSF